MIPELKEFRCKHCGKLFFKGHVQSAVIEIKCKHCKHMNVIRQTEHPSWVVVKQS